MSSNCRPVKQPGQQDCTVGPSGWGMHQQAHLGGFGGGEGGGGLGGGGEGGGGEGGLHIAQAEHVVVKQCRSKSVGSKLLTDNNRHCTAKPACPRTYERTLVGQGRAVGG